MELRERIEVLSGEMVGFLERLVNQESSTTHKEGVDKLGEIMCDVLAGLGLKVDTIPQAEFGNHLVARKAGEGRPILLVGHMDTVYPPDEVVRNPFHTEGYRAMGPGVVDMKGGLAVLLFALRVAREALPDIWERLPLTVFLNSDEELFSPTSAPYIETEAGSSSLALILEPGRPGGGYVTRRKGNGYFKLHVTGKAAHAGAAPETGASAILELCHKIVALNKLNNYPAGLTVNIGVVGGGIRPNVVPDYAFAEIDYRAWTSEDLGWLDNAIVGLCSSPKVAGTTLRLEGGIRVYPMEPGSGSAAAFSLVADAAKQAGFVAKEVSTGGISDGNHTAPFCPTVDGVGPEGGGAHSPDEWLDLRTLVPRTHALVLLLKLWYETHLCADRGSAPSVGTF
jgi:glutamate carboxypeptidase